MTYKFAEEESLGKAVQEVKPFCKLTKKMDVPEERDIVGDFAQPDKYPGLAGRKWSRLCGFTFKSKDGKCFQFVFVPKLKGTLSRNQQAMSGWYCWTLFSNDIDNKQVTSIAEMANKFGFSINKFVHCDLFDKWLAVFKQNIQYALSHQIKELVGRGPDAVSDYKELVRHVNAIEDSLSKIDDVKQVVTPDNKYDDSSAPNYARHSAPKVGNAKIAYNADKTYDLRNTAKASQAEERKRRALEKLAKKMSNDAQPPEDSSSDGIDSSQPASAPQQKSKKSKQYIKYDPSLKYKFGGGRTKKMDAEIFDKYDDYDNDDFR